MRLPRLLFTVRRLMVLVAVVGVLGWGSRVWRDAARYRTLADRYERRKVKLARARYVGPWDPGELERMLRGRHARVLHLGQLARKYDRAAYYP